MQKHFIHFLHHTNTNNKLMNKIEITLKVIHKEPQR